MSVYKRYSVIKYGTVMKCITVCLYQQESAHYLLLSVQRVPMTLSNRAYFASRYHCSLEIHIALHQEAWLCLHWLENENM